MKCEREWKKEDIKRMKEEVAEKIEIDVEKITPSARIKEDLGADSLDMYELMYMLDAEFGLDYSEDILSGLKTVQDFMDLVGIKDTREWKHFELDSKEYEYTYSMSGDLKISYRKRDLEPVIKKSGETWVASFEGVDYLCTRPEKYSDTNTDPELVLRAVRGVIQNISYWKPFSEIEITDTIAKLRPMVVCADCDYCSLLVAVDKKMCFANVVVEPSKSVNRFNKIRLATVKDLEE